MQQTPQLSASVISILQVLNEPSTFETAIKMYEDSRQQFLRNDTIDPFKSFRVTRAQADQANLYDEAENDVENPQSPSAGDRAEAEREIDEADDTVDSRDGSEEEVEGKDDWEVEADSDAEEATEEETATTVPRRFGNVWSGYVSALEVFWTRAENLRFEEALFPNHESICTAGMQLIKMPSFKTIVFKANLELVDRLVSVIIERSLQAISTMTPPK